MIHHRQSGSADCCVVGLVPRGLSGPCNISMFVNKSQISILICVTEPWQQSQSSLSVPGPAWLPSSCPHGRPQAGLPLPSAAPVRRLHQPRHGAAGRLAPGQHVPAGGAGGLPLLPASVLLLAPHAAHLEVLAAAPPPGPALPPPPPPPSTSRQV